MSEETLCRAKAQRAPWYFRKGLTTLPAPAPAPPPPRLPAPAPPRPRPPAPAQGEDLCEGDEEQKMPGRISRDCS